MSIILKNIGLEWASGQQLFNGLNLSLERHIYGLVGPNGVGKTSLARLLVGELSPTSGKVISTDETVFYFPQIEPTSSQTVIEYLLETNVLEEPELLSFLGDIALEQACTKLSGGQWARVRLARTLGLGASFIIFDEPTNHLDRKARQGFYDFLKIFKGGILLITHDRELLGFADKILELSNQGISIHSGGWEEYLLWKQNEREGLFDKLGQAKKIKRELAASMHEKREKQEKRQRRGEKKEARGGVPRIVLMARKSQAQETKGKMNQRSQEKLIQAQEMGRAAYQQLKHDPTMYAKIPQPELPAGKLVLEMSGLNFKYDSSQSFLWPHGLDLRLEGPIRLGVIGDNGSGKSTLLKMIHGQTLPGTMVGKMKTGDLSFAYLDQNYDLLDHNLTVLENLGDGYAENQLRSYLASFLLDSDKVHLKVGLLSGGEKLRLSLAKIFLDEKTTKVLLLDEPTNNLDMANLEFLEDLLSKFTGALLVVSHDERFLTNMALTQRLELKT